MSAATVIADVNRGWGRAIGDSERVIRRYLQYITEEQARSDKARCAAHNNRRLLREWALADALTAIGCSGLLVLPGEAVAS